MLLPERGPNLKLGRMRCQNLKPDMTKGFTLKWYRYGKTSTLPRAV